MPCVWSDYSQEWPGFCIIYWVEVSLNRMTCHLTYGGLYEIQNTPDLCIVSIVDGMRRPGRKSRCRSGLTGQSSPSRGRRSQASRLKGTNRRLTKHGRNWQQAKSNSRLLKKNYQRQSSHGRKFCSRWRVSRNRYRLRIRVPTT